MKCFFHTDADGFACAAIILWRYPQTRLIGINHGQKIDFSRIYLGEPVAMVDFTSDVETMRRLHEKCSFIWIDHHDTAIQKIDDAGLSDIKGLRRSSGSAGCDLVWEFFEKNNPKPVGIHYIGQYDIKHPHDHDDININYFTSGSRMYDTRVSRDSMYWRKIFNDDQEFISEVINKGKIIFEYDKQTNLRYMKSCGYTIDFMGYRAAVVNKGYVNSLQFDGFYDPEIHDLMISYAYRKEGFWTVSLYTTKEIHVGELAQQFTFNGQQGGGHPKAAGFQTSDISMLLPQGE